jgi:hypothetical protein
VGITLPLIALDFITPEKPHPSAESCSIGYFQKPFASNYRVFKRGFEFSSLTSPVGVLMLLIDRPGSAPSLPRDPLGSRQLLLGFVLTSAINRIKSIYVQSMGSFGIFPFWSVTL